MYNPNEGIGRPGRFLIKKFKDKAVNIFTSNENEQVHYSQTSQTAWTLLKCIIKDYDEESGMITIKSLFNEDLFYLNEFKVELVFLIGSNYTDLIGDTVGRRMTAKSKDIMK